MGAQKGLLHEVLGVVSVAGHSIRRPEEGPQVREDLRFETLVTVHVAAPGVAHLHPETTPAPPLYSRRIPDGDSVTAR
jgi:hypothetical protein